MRHRAGGSLAGPYHEREYGFPIRRDAALFEHLALEINQAGLSWLTVLKKRKAFRRAFERFDRRRLASYGARENAGCFPIPESSGTD